MMQLLQFLVKPLGYEPHAKETPVEKLVYLEQIDSLAPWCEVIEASFKKTLENRGTQRNDALSCNHWLWNFPFDGSIWQLILANLSPR